MTRAFFAITLLLLGVGCTSPQDESLATADMLPESFAIMEGMEPLDEERWRLIGSDDLRRIDSTWQTDAQFDEVIAFYEAKFAADGLVTHRVDNYEGVRLYWGLLDRVRFAKPETNDFLYAAKKPIDGKTVVRLVIKPRTK